MLAGMGQVMGFELDTPASPTVLEAINRELAELRVATGWGSVRHEAGQVVAELGQLRTNLVHR